VAPADVQHRGQKRTADAGKAVIGAAGFLLGRSVRFRTDWYRQLGRIAGGGVTMFAGFNVWFAPSTLVRAAECSTKSSHVFVHALLSGEFVMSKLLSVLIASVLAASMSLAVAATDATKTEVKAEKAGATEVKKESKADVTETKKTSAATEKTTDAKAEYKSAEQNAKANYKVATADCKTKPAAEQKTCLSDAKTAKNKSIADAKATMNQAAAEAKAAKKKASAEAATTKDKAKMDEKAPK
jgi:colicin import membrane protein